MTVCEICGGDQFTLEDGFYFCNECHTQSQDIREIVTDDLYAKGTKQVRKMAVSDETRAHRQRSKEVKSETRGVRRRLGSSEVINLLLRRWTAVLVSRGAPEHLPEVTAPLWEALLRSGHGRGGDVKISSAVALLWLALADCEPLCRLSDLLRWARQGIVPIYSAANELPEDVTFAWGQLLLSRKLSAVGMRVRLVAMVKKLRLPPPPQPPLCRLLRHLLPELALPVRLADVVANVARRAPPLDTFLPEADALALLLVTLKMLLGLDDATEIRNSEVAAARNAAQPDGPRWFVFSDWLQFVLQQRAAAGEQDFTELETHDRDLDLLAGPDLCRRHHRQLLFDFYRREGTFRRSVEAPFAGYSASMKPDFKLQSRRLFGRPRAPATPPPNDTDDLLRPVGSRLEREGGEPLRQAERFRHAQVDFLLDESHVRRLQSEGVAVAVTRAAARQRVRTLHKTERVYRAMALSSVKRDIQLVGRRKSAIPPPEKPLPRPRRRRRDLRLFMPYREVWCLPASWTSPAPRRDEYREVSMTWPISFQVLMEVLAASIELTPTEFAHSVFRAERSVLGVDPQASTGGRMRRKKRTEKKREGKSRTSAAVTRKRRRRESEGDSTTDVSSAEMELGSETESDLVEGAAPPSPDLFDE